MNLISVNTYLTLSNPVEPYKSCANISQVLNKRDVHILLRLEDSALLRRLDCCYTDTTPSHTALAYIT